MNKLQIDRYEHSEPLIQIHCYLIRERKPVSRSTRIKWKAQAALRKLNASLGQLFKFLNSTLEP